ncbi:MAG: NUDIX hydrolase [Nanoarchaeota archaeon]|nr:NUDIX hydrolase [Nanoarchaeota archaeon]
MNIRNKEENNIISIWKPLNCLNSPVTQIAGICFNDNGEILIIGNKGKWNFPGGHPEKGEDMIDTLKREILEEASIEIDNCKHIGYTEVIYPKNPDKFEGDHFFQAKFICTAKDINKQTKDPSTGIIYDRLFVKPQKLFDLIKWKDIRDIISTALEEYEKFKLK